MGALFDRCSSCLMMRSCTSLWFLSCGSITIRHSFGTGGSSYPCDPRALPRRRKWTGVGRGQQILRSPFFDVSVTDLQCSSILICADACFSHVLQSTRPPPKSSLDKARIQIPAASRNRGPSQPALCGPHYSKTPRVSCCIPRR